GEKNVLAESGLFALALAIGIAPEALPAIITVCLTTGSRHLASKKVITKKLAAIEDLGNMDVLCTDKTGTLTEESLRMDKYVDLDRKDSHDVFEYALLCNSSVGSGNHIKGNAVDVAIAKRGHSLKTDLSRFCKVQEIPFDYQRRRMGQVVDEGKKRYLIVKGAPESILSVCSKIRMSFKLHGKNEKEVELRRVIDSYHEEGHSAIGVGYKEIEKKGAYSKDDEEGLVFIGFVLFSNPPKHTVKETLGRLKKLNVKLKILTGDDALVTRKLCSDIGFSPAFGRIVLGSELRGMEGDEFSQAIEKFDVFARVAPDQKLAIVEGLRKGGHVVGFMGDGINDAPAIRAADVGISVNTAADVAKGASHIILLKKSLGVVCDGVEEGRRIFGNIMKYILNTMSANNGNMITVAVSSVFLPFIPLLPSQILLNNLISDLPMFAISRDNVDRETTRTPHKWDINLIMRFMLFFGLISTLFDLVLIGILYFVMGTDVGVFRTAWFLQSILSEIIIVFSLRTHLPFFRSMPSWLLVISSILAAAVSVGVIYFGPVAELFQFAPLGAPVLLLIAGILAAYFAATEIGKAVFYSRFASSN
ncbi:MAG: HAD-IC family P-type ATPase, partial [Candidatus Micrarchaeota archaeon]